MRYFCTTLLLIIISLNACSTATLKALPVPPKIYAVAKGNKRKVRVQIVHEDKSIPAGHQYALMVIPFGNVVVDNLEEHIGRGIFQSLILHGYQPLAMQTQASNNIPTLKVNVVNYRATAYDLLALRRIVCEVNISGQLLINDGTIRRQGVGESRIVAYKEFAFTPQIEHFWQRAVIEATNNLIDDLSL